MRDKGSFCYNTFICVGFSVDRVGISANTYKEPICRRIIAKSSAALRDKTAHLAAVVSCLLIQNYEIVLDYFSLCPSCINNQRVTNLRFGVQQQHVRIVQPLVFRQSEVFRVQLW